VRRVGLWTLALLGLLALAQQFTGDYRTHDPSLIRAGNTLYVFSTADATPGAGGIQLRASQDGKNWKYLGTLFADLPAWIVKEVGFVPNLWAPDISYWNGKYHLYYAASTFGSQDSAIGLATNVTLDPKNPNYKWVDQGMVLRSSPSDSFNAIDPNFVRDAKGQPWLVWGSYWDGIRLHRLDAATGKLAKGASSTGWLRGAVGPSRLRESSTETATTIFSSHSTLAARGWTAPTTSAWAAPKPSPVPT